MKILSKRARAKDFWKWTPEVEAETERKLELLGFKGKTEIDAGYFYAPYIPLMTYNVKRSPERRIFYVDTTPVQKPVYSQLSVLRECRVDNRFGRTGDR